MEFKKNCSERMRPILQAMERSIDCARRDRVGHLPPTPLSNALDFQRPSPSQTLPSPSDVLPYHGAEVAEPRLKARPKRLDSPLVNPFEKLPWRSQAG